MRKHRWLILALVMLLGMGLNFTPRGGGIDQADFPLIYIDADAAGGGVGSQADPYNELSDVNQTTGGDNSIFDYLAGSPSQSPQVLHQKGDEWREQHTVVTSGTATYPIILGSYGSGAKPIINGANLVTTWEQSETVSYTMTSNTTGDFCLRSLVPASSMSIGGTKIRIRMEANSAENTTISGSYIGQKASSGDAFDMEVGTITAITWNTGSASVIIPAGETKWSDWITYSFDRTKDYFISLGITDYVRQTASSAGQSYYKAGASAESGTANVTGYTSYTPMYFKDFEVSFNNTWYATLTSTPTQIFLDETLGTSVASVAEVNGANKWYYDGTPDILYIYSTTDPDSAYNAPGIEASIRNTGINVDTKNYITIQDLEIKYAKYQGVRFATATNGIVNNVTVSYCYNECILIAASEDCVVSNCMASYSAATGVIVLYQGHGNIAEYNDASYYTGGDHRGSIHIANTEAGDANTIIRYNYCHNDTWAGIYISSQSVGVEIYYNLVKDCEYNIDFSGGGSPYNKDIDVYNNIVYTASDSDSALAIWDTYNINVKNNIFYAVSGAEVIVSLNTYSRDASNVDINNNCYYHAGGGTFCNIDGVGNQAWSWWTNTQGWDANGINTDPLMTDPANDDFTLSYASPCIDKGTDVGLAEDYAGNPISSILISPILKAHKKIIETVFFNLPDIGAYEW